VVVAYVSGVGRGTCLHIWRAARMTNHFSQADLFKGVTDKSISTQDYTSSGKSFKVLMAHAEHIELEHFVVKNCS